MAIAATLSRNASQRERARAYFTGTHRGPLEGIPPTGKPVKVKDVDLFRIENGKVVESSTTFDRLGMLKQLGIISVPEEREEG